MSKDYQINEVQIDQLPITSYCNRCGKTYLYYGKVKTPSESFCSDSCRSLFQEMQNRGYPNIREGEWKFWSGLFAKKRMKQNIRIQHQINKLKEERSHQLTLGGRYANSDA